MDGEQLSESSIIEREELLVKSVRDLRDRFLKDPYRPGYHIVSPEGRYSPFDPNGAIFWKGKYHLFYIFQGEKGHSWGHVSSIDLVHWRHHPVALYPEAGDVDTGIFSGGAFIDNNQTPTIIYQGIGAGICIATSKDDNLDHWIKYPENPVIPYTKPGHPGYGVYNVADPSSCWFKNGRYYVVSGNIHLLIHPEFKEFREKRKPEELGDTVYLFESEDLIHWKYLHPFYRSDRRWTFHKSPTRLPILYWRL
jgi:beta-fructofuranosidase